MFAYNREIRKLSQEMKPRTTDRGSVAAQELGGLGRGGVTSRQPTGPEADGDFEIRVRGRKRPRYAWSPLGSLLTDAADGIPPQPEQVGKDPDPLLLSPPLRKTAFSLQPEVSVVERVHRM